MKIAFNPSTVAALTSPPKNKDITFDLRGRNIFARGVEFKGTDTNTWRDIKINNVSIGSNILDLRNGSNTTLTNSKGVVTINSTWRPVVDSLTSDSTTSSLSANQGRVLKSLIDGKSDSGHNHDGRYVRYYAVTALDCNNLAVGLTVARITATNAAHTNHSAYLYISDVGTPFQLQIPDSSVPYIYKRYYGSGKWSGWFKLNAGYADSAGSVDWGNVTNKPATATRWPSWGEVTGKPDTFTPAAHTHDHLVINAADEKSFNSAYHDFQVLYAGGGNGIAGRPSGVDAFGLIRFRAAYGWSGQMLLANGGSLYIRSSGDAGMTSTLAWKTILDSSNYSGILDSRYYTEAEVNSLLDAKLNRQNLSYGTWNPRGYNLAADYFYNGGDLSISESKGQIHVSINGYFWQNEGQYRVLDTSDIAGLKNAITLHQYLSNTDTTWWPLIWGGSSHNNTSDSTGAVYKSHDKLSWQTNSQTLYATRFRTTFINLENNRGISRVTTGGTSPYKGIKLPDLQSNGLGMFSRFSNSTDEGGIIISEDTSVIYNSFDTGWGLSVRDKDLNQTDISNDNTIAFGVRQDHRAYSLGGFEKAGSSNSYVLLGGGDHKLESALNVANADKLDGYHADNIQSAGWRSLYRTGGSSGVIKWTRIGRCVSTARDNSNNDGMIEFHTNGDQNYKYFGHGKMQISQYGPTSKSLMLSSVTSEGIHFYATIDSSGYIWLGHNAWWSGNSAYRVIWSGSYIEWYSSDMATSTEAPNSTYIIDNGTFKYPNEVGQVIANNTAVSWYKVLDKIVAGNEFNVVNAGFKEDLWFNYLPINDRSKSATISAYCFGNGNKGYTAVRASGFIINGGTSQQLLRADGGIAGFNWAGQSGQPTWLWGGNNFNSYYVYNPSNFRVAYAASAGNAEKLGGMSKNYGQSPFGTIPCIGNNGVMEIGKYIDFHNDNSGKHDYSTRLQTTGNYGNSVNLPSASGTLALISQVLTWKSQIIDMRSYSESYWHPVTVPLPNFGYNKIKVSVQLNSGDKPSWATHNSGITCNMEIWATSSGQGTTDSDTICLNYTYKFCSQNPCGWMQLSNPSLGVVFLRGGSRYTVYTDFDAVFTPHNQKYTWSNGSSSQDTGGPYTSCPGLNFNMGTIRTDLIATLVQARRVCAGHDPGIDNSISCSNWFRSSGNTGWYNTTYQGGWYMSDTSWIRAHNNVGIYTGGQIYSSSSVKAGNICLEHTDEINNITGGGVNLNYRNSGNVSLCVGGGNVGIGTMSPTYKLHVNGGVKSSGFHHSSVNSDNYMLLAGGGYKSFGGDDSNPIFLGYLNLDHGNDGTISSSFSCLGYSVPFTYTRGGNYCRIYIPNTTHQVFYIKAATASVNYSGGGMDTWTGVHKGSGAWWLHCYAYGANEIRVKGFCQNDNNNDSWWGGNPLWSGNDGANKITVCIFGYVKFR